MNTLQDILNRFIHIWVNMHSKGSCLKEKGPLPTDVLFSIKALDLVTYSSTTPERTTLINCYKYHTLKFETHKKLKVG